MHHPALKMNWMHKGMGMILGLSSVMAAGEAASKGQAEGSLRAGGVSDGVGNGVNDVTIEEEGGLSGMVEGPREGVAGMRLIAGRVHSDERPCGKACAIPTLKLCRRESSSAHEIVTESPEAEGGAGIGVEDSPGTDSRLKRVDGGGSREIPEVCRGRG